VGAYSTSKTVRKSIKGTAAYILPAAYLLSSITETRLDGNLNNEKEYQMELEDIKKAQEELVKEANEYFKNFYEWEEEQLKKFAGEEGD